MIKGIYGRIKKITNSFAAILLLIIFLAFCANVILRYTIGESFGWVIEFSVILWIWVVFLGAGIFLDKDDHVSFSWMHRVFGKKTQIILRTLSFYLVFIGGILLVSPVWDYLEFQGNKESGVIGIPMNRVYMVYKIFLISIIIKYGYLTISYSYRILRYGFRHLYKDISSSTNEENDESSYP